MATRNAYRHFDYPPPERSAEPLPDLFRE